MNKFIVALLLTLALDAQASVQIIESLVLNDGSIIGSDKISNVHIFPYIKTIDYIDLNEGSRIESSEIKKVNFLNRLEGHSSGLRMGNQAFMTKVGGDGSGG
jgi:hypothetical protein